jgi:hypothetical protein
VALSDWDVHLQRGAAVAFPDRRRHLWRDLNRHLLLQPHIGSRRGMTLIPINEDSALWLAYQQCYSQGNWYGCECGNTSTGGRDMLILKGEEVGGACVDKPGFHSSARKIGGLWVQSVQSLKSSFSLPRVMAMYSSKRNELMYAILPSSSQYSKEIMLHGIQPLS